MLHATGEPPSQSSSHSSSQSHRRNDSGLCCCEILLRSTLRCAASISYSIFYFADAVIGASDQVRYAASAQDLAASVNDWSAAFALERGAAYLALQEDNSRCPGGGRPVDASAAWAAAMNTARLTASPALSAACLAVPSANISVAIAAARSCTDEAAASMLAAAGRLSVDDEQKVAVAAFLGAMISRLRQIRTAFDARAACAAPAQIVLLNSAIAGMVQQAHHTLNFAAPPDVEVPDKVQDAGLCLQAAYAAEMAGVDVFRVLLAAEAAPAIAAHSSGNLTVAAAAHVGDIAILPLLTSATRLLDVSGLLHTTDSPVAATAQRLLDALAQATMTASLTLLAAGGNSLAVRAVLNRTSAAWSSSLATVASSLASASNTLIQQHIFDTEQDRRNALKLIVAPVSAA